MSDELGILLSTLLFARRDPFGILTEETWFVDSSEVERMADKKRFNIKVRV